jgi:hypothetical protein
MAYPTLPKDTPDAPDYVVTGHTGWFVDDEIAVVEPTGLSLRH